ncbi:MAG: SDR family oxidoreductase [Bacteroidaceae bacterium]|nr:SDR family oxidoreductase [Bacteroidaceae bacterium]
MSFNPFSLEGKTIVVTGASSGIGQQCVIDCSKMGAKVVLIGRNEQRLSETLSSLEGEGHLSVTFDLTNFDDLKGCVKSIVEKAGPIDGLVNCAGISTTLPLKLMNAEKMDEFFHSNVFSSIELTRHFCQMGKVNKSGASIVFLSSIMALAGENGKSLYSMTKGALLSAVRSLACEFARRNIRFNAVSPGAILTPINQDLPHMKNPEARAALESKHLLGLGKTTDISNACIYLLSDASRWVTGQNLVVDGGYTAR